MKHYYIDTRRCAVYNSLVIAILHCEYLIARVTFSWLKAHSSKISYVLCSPLISCQKVHISDGISISLLLIIFARPKKLLPTYDNNGIRQNSNYFKVTTKAEVFRNMLIHPEHSEVTPD